MAAAPGTDLFSLMLDDAHTFVGDFYNCEDINADFGDIFDGVEDVDLSADHHQQAVLLELTEEMALLTAELQQLKNDQAMTDCFVTPVPAAMPTLKSRSRSGSASSSSSMPLSSQGNTNKRRKVTGLLAHTDYTEDEDIASGFVFFMSKEELLSTITTDLPPQYLEGVIRIVNPAFDPATATDEDFEFDINSLAEDVLYQLMQYVRDALEISQKDLIASAKQQAAVAATVTVPRKTASSTTKRTNATRSKPVSSTPSTQPSATTKRTSNATNKKEGPRQRLMKRAPKKRTGTAQQHTASCEVVTVVPTSKRKPKAVATQQNARKKKQQQQQAQQLLIQQQQQVHVLRSKKETVLVSGELMREIFSAEEIIRVQKCMSDEEEDEDVDILEL